MRGENILVIHRPGGACFVSQGWSEAEPLARLVCALSPWKGERISRGDKSALSGLIYFFRYSSRGSASLHPWLTTFTPPGWSRVNLSQKTHPRRISSLFLCALLLASLPGCSKNEPVNRAGGKLTIVVAENFYGGVAQEIAGDSANVISVLINPNQNPHQFTTDAATAKAVADADIVIYNGIGYDEWMMKLLATNGNPSRVAIRVSDLIGAKAGDDPHVWYDPRTMPALAARLADILKRTDGLAHFQKEMSAVTSQIAEIKSKYDGTSVTATEPVFDYMARALGFKVENEGFQHAVMNGTEPSAEQTADFEKSLRDKSVKILFYNSQVTSPATDQIVALAKASGVPVVGVTEMQPPDTKNYADWMLEELNKVETALSPIH